MLELYANNSKKPIYKDDISNETLKRTAEIYSRIVSNLEQSVVGNILFYHNMFQSFRLETVLKTLARILLETKRDKTNPDYKTARAVFIKITKMLNLTNRDVAVSTTAAQELSFYHHEAWLDNLQVNQELFNGKNNKKSSQILDFITQETVLQDWRILKN